MVDKSNGSVSHYSAVLCQETIDPGTHVDGRWHQPSTPDQIKHVPHDTGTPKYQPKEHEK